MELYLSFDDVLIEPTYTTIMSRKDVDTTTEVAGIKLSVPLISSPMDTVTEFDMALAVGQCGGLGIIHRFASPEKRIEMIQDMLRTSFVSDQCLSDSVPVCFAVGASREEIDFLQELERKVDLGSLDATVCIDIANGYSRTMERMIDHIKMYYPNLKIIAGNVANGDGYEFLASMGVDAVRVGIGSGSICKTRIQTGVGLPLLHSILDCSERKRKLKNKFLNAPDILADGGIRYPQDLCKSLIAGASAVICGNIFAGTQESPGEIIEIDEQQFKVYRGMASKEVQEEKRGGLKEGTVAEGVSTHLPYKGSITPIINEFRGGLASSMTYLDARTLEEYIDRPDRFRRITENGIKESHAYGTRKR